MVTNHQDLTTVITQSDQSSVNLIKEIQFKFFQANEKFFFGKGQYGAIYGSFDFLCSQNGHNGYDLARDGLGKHF